MIEYENLGELNRPFFEAYQQNFETTLKSGWYILGKNVREFEANFASYCTTKHSIGVASGLDALLLALKIHNFAPGSEVIVPSNTYIATILAIVQAGLKPVLVEPNIASYNIDPTKIEHKINKSTVAIMLVHLYGQCCEMDPIIQLCTQYKLELIEDCAQSHGSSYKGKLAGSFGTGAFSFYPTKNLGALGDAGALTTNNDLFAEKFRTFRNYGSKTKYYNEEIGYNSRLDEIQAGFLNIKLAALNKINAHKNTLANQYNSELNEQFIKPLVDQDYYHTYHIYNIRHPKRDELKQYLLEKGIKTEIHYPLAPHQQKAYQHLFEKEDYPIAEEIHRTTLSLPISFCHSEADIAFVVKTLNQF